MADTVFLAGWIPFMLFRDVEAMRKIFLPLPRNVFFSLGLHLAGFPLVLKSRDFWRVKNQAMKSHEIVHWF